MQTPFGSLASIARGGQDRLKSVLRADKHQILEGRIVQSFFDDILDHRAVADVASPVPATICIASITPASAYAFVWCHRFDAGVRVLLDRMSSRLEVYPIRYDPEAFEFFISSTPYDEGIRPIMDVPLRTGLHRLSGRTPRANPVDSSVRDQERQDKAIDGLLLPRFGDRLFEDVVLPRVFMNYGIGPYFQGAVDIDRIVRVGDRFCALEFKHKFPRAGATYHGKAIPLYFGLNATELNSYERLMDCGLEFKHILLVKPTWDKETSSIWVTEEEQRKAALLIGRRFDRSYVEKVRRRRLESGANTTFSGKGRLTFHPLYAREFVEIAPLADPDKAANVISQLLVNPAIQLTAVTEARLESLRLRS